MLFCVPMMVDDENVFVFLFVCFLGASGAYTHKPTPCYFTNIDESKTKQTIYRKII